MSLNKPIKLLLLTIIIKFVFSEDNKFYRQLFLDDALYDVQKYYNTKKIDVSEWTDVNKTSASEEYELCHYWFCEDIGFKLEKHVCNGCHDLLTMAYYLKNMAILSTTGAAFRCILMGIRKNEGLRRLNNSVTYDRGVL